MASAAGPRGRKRSFSEITRPCNVRVNRNRLSPTRTPDDVLVASLGQELADAKGRIIQLDEDLKRAKVENLLLLRQNSRLLKRERELNCRVICAANCFSLLLYYCFQVHVLRQLRLQLTEVMTKMKKTRPP